MMGIMTAFINSNITSIKLQALSKDGILTKMDYQKKKHWNFKLGYNNLHHIP
jgi:hypothetical protein